MANSNSESSASYATRRALANISSKIGGVLGQVLIPIPILGKLIGGRLLSYLSNKLFPGLKKSAEYIFAGIIAAQVKSLVISLVSIIVFILLAGFIMLVVNNSAYVAPAGKSVTSQVFPDDWPTINIGASCPIPGGQLLWGSYGNPNTIGHGTNEYWDAVEDNCGKYSLPFTGICYAKQPGDYCYTPAKACSYYGFAADFIYPGTQTPGQPVYLPYIEGDEVSWSATPIAGGGRGTIQAVHNGTTYEAYVTHLQAAPVGGVSGNVFGRLAALPSPQIPHLHIELRVDGVFVPPEFMCTEGFAGGIGVVEREGCFEFTGSWPEELIKNEVQAAKIIISNKNYSNKLCAGGTITINYNENGKCIDGVCYGGEIVSKRELDIYPPGTGNVANALFTLAHETAHIYDNAFGDSVDYWLDEQIQSELPLYDPQGLGFSTIMNAICTYPLDNVKDAPGKQVAFVENFAESIALFIAGPNPESSYRDMACMGGTFQDVYPNSWQHVRDKIFLNDGPW